MRDQQLAEALLSENPAEVVLIGEPVFRLARILAELTKAAAAPQVCESPSIEVYRQQLGAEGFQSADRVICLHLPGAQSQPQIVLGLACRISPRLVLVEHVGTSADDKLLDDEQFFAFGYQRIRTATDRSGTKRQLYAYRLSDYKQAPDWLNARFWAHPERFDVPD